MERSTAIITQAVSILRGGGVIIMPTDTLFGLAVDAGNEDAVRRVYSLKKRPLAKGLPVMISSREIINSVSEDIREYAEILMTKYWPGALTAALKKSSKISLLVTGGSDKITVRVPNHPTALEILREFRKPLAVTSANISGEGGSEDYERVKQNFQGKVDMIIPGEITLRTPSTIVDCTGATPVILRQGAIVI